MHKSCNYHELCLPNSGGVCGLEVPPTILSKDDSAGRSSWGVVPVPLRLVDLMKHNGTMPFGFEMVIFPHYCC